MRQIILAFTLGALCQSSASASPIKNWTSGQISFDGVRPSMKLRRQDEGVAIKRVSTPYSTLLGAGTGFVSGAVIRELAENGIPRRLEHSNLKEVPAFLFNRYTVIGVLVCGTVGFALSFSTNSGIRAVENAQRKD